MSTKESLRAGLKYLNCFLPVYKPKGFCCNKLLFAFKSDFYFVLNQNDINHGGIIVNYVRALEPFADGLITFSVGRSYMRRRNFIHANYRYKATVEFGVGKEYDCRDGKMVSRCSIDHLNVDLIESALSNFIGLTEQDRTLFIHDSSDKSYVETRDKDIVNIYDRLNIPGDRPEKFQQKYPLQYSKRNAVCGKIQLVDYYRPYATLDIECLGSFCMRSFTRNLAKILDVKANLCELTRTIEGPIGLGDMHVLQPYELHLEYYLHRLPAINAAYGNYIAQYDDKFETPVRPKF